MVQAKEYLGKHYTNTEKTGLTKEEIKEKAVLRELNNYTYDENNNSIETPSVRRYYLRLAIGKALSELLHKPIDHCTIYKNINYLLGLGFIKQNPDSHITVNDNILPDNMTNYKINAEAIHERLIELAHKQDAFNKEKGKFSLSPTLNSFSNIAEESKLSSQVQKEKKSTSQETY